MAATLCYAFPMLLWCGLTSDDLGDGRPDLIVFPEGVDHRDMARAAELCPDAIIVAAVLEGRRMRGVIFHRGEEQIAYYKVGSDGRSASTPRPDVLDIYEVGDLAVGILVCMDIDPTGLRDEVIQRLHESTAPLKALCVPADMYAQWFSTDPIMPPTLKGIHLIVSNNLFHGANRLRNFITGTDRKKLVVQADREPISLLLDAADPRPK